MSSPPCTSCRCCVGAPLTWYGKSVKPAVASISGSTLWRWLHQDAIRPWYHRSWIFPKDPDFAEKAGRLLDLYDRQWEDKPLKTDEFVICADEKDEYSSASPPASNGAFVNLVVRLASRIDTNAAGPGFLGTVGCLDFEEGSLGHKTTGYNWLGKEKVKFIGSVSCWCASIPGRVPAGARLDPLIRSGLRVLLHDRSFYNPTKVRAFSMAPVQKN